MIFLDHLKQYLPEIAAHGDLALVADHKHVNKKQGDHQKKSFGIAAIITDRFGNEVSVFLEYIPTDSSAAVENLPHLQATLVKYNLMKAFRESKISFSVDGAMIKTIVDLFANEGLQPIVSYCQVHNVDNIMKRTVEANLDQHLPNGSEQYRNLQTKINAAVKDLEDYLKNKEVMPRNKNKVNQSLIVKPVFYTIF